MMSAQKIGIIGGRGKLGWKLVQNFIENNFATMIGTRENVWKKYQKLTYTAEEIAQECSTIIVSVKPKDVFQVCQRISNIVNQDDKKLVISVAAAIPYHWYDRWFKPDNFIRLMPTCFVKNKGSMLGIQCSDKSYDLHLNHLQQLFKAHMYRCLTSGDMDRFTIVGSCSPALYARLYNSILQSYKGLGLPTDQANKIIRHGMLNLILDKTYQDPWKLIDDVATYGGVTHAGLRLLEEENIDEIICQSIREMDYQCSKIRDQLAGDYFPSKK